MITQALYQELQKITEEERALLSGDKSIQKDLYMVGDSDVIDAARLLEKGKLIQVRPHTRFVHFPKHSHNYIEVIYMCSGSTRHLIDGVEIVLKEGELLFLNQNAMQEIYPAGENDIAVNFIVLPEFFDYGLKLMGNEENLLREFVIDCLTGKNYTELVQAKRLNQAVYLLENTNMPVLDVGLAVGYDNQSYFHRIFQKRFGVTPKKYRDAKDEKVLKNQLVLLTSIVRNGNRKFLSCKHKAEC